MTRRLEKAAKVAVLAALALAINGTAGAEEPAPVAGGKQKASPIRHEAGKGAKNAVKRALEAKRATGQSGVEARKALVEPGGGPGKPVQEAREHLKQAREQAREAAKEAREQAREAAKEAHGQVKQAREHAREAVSGALDHAKEVKREAIQAMGAVRQEVREAAREGRKAARLRLWKQLKARLSGRQSVPAAMRAELKIHARRMAQLKRVQSIAVEKQDTEAVTRVAELVGKEEVRHKLRMEKLTQPDSGEMAAPVEEAKGEMAAPDEEAKGNTQPQAEKTGGE